MLTMWDRVVIGFLEKGLKESGECNIHNISLGSILRISNNRKDRLILFKYAIENVLQDIESKNGEKILEGINKELAQ